SVANIRQLRKFARENRSGDGPSPRSSSLQRSTWGRAVPTPFLDRRRRCHLRRSVLLAACALTPPRSAASHVRLACLPPSLPPRPSCRRVNLLHDPLVHRLLDRRRRCRFRRSVLLAASALTPPCWRPRVGPMVERHATIPCLSAIIYLGGILSPLII